MPRLTRLMGPYLLPEFRQPKTEIPLIAELIQGLPRVTAFEQDVNYTIHNWLPFYWEGFRQTTRYSYRIDLSLPEAMLFQGLDVDYRNNKLKKAEAAVVLQTGGSLADFYRVHNLSYTRQQIEHNINFDFLERLYHAALVNHSAALFFAVDPKDGAIHSTALVVYDAHTAYLLMAGDDPALRNSGAGVFLIWEIIKWAKHEKKLQAFDFCGSMLKGVERVRRNFGALPQPYFRIRKEWSLPWRLGKLLLRE